MSAIHYRTSTKDHDDDEDDGQFSVVVLVHWLLSCSRSTEVSDGIFAN